MPVVRNQQFYFKEGFCWTEIKTFYIRCRLKEKSINSNKSMSFYPLHQSVPDSFLISLLNSEFAATYVNSFINNTQTFGIDDARQIPIVIPTRKELQVFFDIFDDALEVRKKQTNQALSNKDAEKALSKIQKKLDSAVAKLYKIV